MTASSFLPASKALFVGQKCSKPGVGWPFSASSGCSSLSLSPQGLSPSLQQKQAEKTEGAFLFRERVSLLLSDDLFTEESGSHVEGAHSSLSSHVAQTDPFIWPTPWPQDLWSWISQRKVHLGGAPWLLSTWHHRQHAACSPHNTMASAISGFSVGNSRSLTFLSLPGSAIPSEKLRECLATHLPREAKGLEQGMSPPQPTGKRASWHIASRVFQAPPNGQELLSARYFT